jgi:putative ABC transport system permease protein
MINRMVVANLRRRPMRSLVSVTAVAIEVVLILMIVGLTNGMIHDQRARINGIGADVIVRAGNGSMFAELTGNTLPLAEAAVFARQPGVEAVAPMSLHVDKGISAVGGIEPASFEAVSGGFRFLHGRMFRAGSHEAIEDDLQAAASHDTVGKTLRMMGQNFRLVGIFEHGMGSRVFIDLGVLNRLAGSPGMAAMFYIKTRPGVDKLAVVRELKALAPSDTVQSIDQYLSLFTASEINPAVPIFQSVMIGIAVAIGFLVIFLSLYTTVLERTREIGILKSLGASRGYIVRVILRESELLAATGAVAGTIVAYGLWRSLERLFPTLTIEMTWTWVGVALAIAMVSSAIGALYPAFRAAGQDAIAALAYE